MADATTTVGPQRVARWVTVLGVVMIIAGVLAVIAPAPAALATTFFFAVMFLVGEGGGAITGQELIIDGGVIV